MLRRAIAKLALAGFFIGSAALALAGQQTVWYGQQTVTSPGLNLQNRYDRIAFGTWMMSALGLTSAGQGVYSNLTTAPGVGLYVTTTPTLSGSNGAVYQVEENDPNPLPSSCPAAVVTCPQISPDRTLIGAAAFQSGTSNPIGPLTAPVVSGDGIYYLIEAQISTGNDQTLTPEQFIIQSLGIYSPQTFTVNSVRADQLAYQSKAGTPATANCTSTFPTEPTVDSGWIAIAYVCVPYGASSITSGEITAATAFTGFSESAAAVTSVTASGNITASPTIGNVAIGEVANPTWTSGTAAAFNETGTNVTTCWLCFGSLGTASTNVLRFGNATSGSSYTAIGAANDGTVAGVQDAVLSIGNSSTRVLALGSTGNLGIASYFAALGYVVAGEASAPTMTAGDLGASRSSSSGLLALGGSSSDCTLDYGVASSAIATLGCPIEVNGTIATIAANASVTATGLVVAGSGTAPVILTAGDLISSNSTTTGTLLMGGGSYDGALTFGSTIFTFDNPVTITPNNPDLNSYLVVTDNASTSPTVSNGDIGASESASTGRMYLGGSSSKCALDYGISFSGQAAVGCTLNAPNIVDSGLAAIASPGMVCGNSSSALSSGAAGYEASSGNLSVTQSATLNTYTTFGTVSLSPGTSCGPTNKWLITITAVTNGPVSIAGDYFACMASSSTYTLVDGPVFNGTSTCGTTLTNSFAGSPGFGASTAGALTGSGYTMISHVTVANNATFSVTVETAVSISSAANKILGYVNLVATPI